MASNGWQWTAMTGIDQRWLAIAGNCRPWPIRLPPSTETKKAESPKIVENCFCIDQNQVVQKWSKNCSGPSQMMTPKSDQKIVKKWTQQDLGSKNSKHMPTGMAYF